MLFLFHLYLFIVSLHCPPHLEYKLLHNAQSLDPQIFVE